MEQGQHPSPDDVVVEQARTGDPVDFTDRTDPENNDPHGGDKWGPERTVSAEVIRSLATEPQDPPVHPKGIRIRGARIQGQLDFEGARLLVPLRLEQCYIGKRIILTNASVPEMDLRGSYAPDGVRAGRLEVQHHLTLGVGFHARSEVRLVGATVGGQLNCGGGNFENPTGFALYADGIDVKGGIFLREGFTAKGEVRLTGATVGGQLACRGGNFDGSETKDGYALSADGIDAKGGIFLNEGFTAKGQVRLLGAAVGHLLSCIGGNFDGSETKDGYALSADGIDVRGGIFLRDGFTAKGQVCFREATVGGVLDCRGGKFEGSETKDCDALSADGIDVKGNILLNNGFTAKGEVRLVGATIGGNLECIKGTFQNPKGFALSADGIDVKGVIFLSGGFAAMGQVCLREATVGGQLTFRDGNFDGSETKGGFALSADGIHVKGATFLSEGFTAKGEVRLVGATISGQLNCRGGNFDGSETEDRFALAAQRIKAIELWLGGGELKGAMNFFGANVGVLYVDGGFAGKEAKSGATGKLDLRNVRALSVHDKGADWSGCKLVLDGFVYEHIYRFPNDNVEKRLKWLRRQDPEHFFPQPYDQVVRTLRRMGYGEDARQIGIEKYKDWNKHLTLPRRIWPFFLHCFVGHGYRPQWAVFWMASIALVGALFFWAGSSANLMKPALKEKVCTSRQVAFSPLLYSVDLLVPSGVMGVNFHEKSCFVPTYPDSKSVARWHGILAWVLWWLPARVLWWPCEVWYYLEVFLGPILMVFLGAALGGLIDRETT